MIRRKMLRRALSRDRAVEDPAHAGSVEISGTDAKADDPANEDVHHHHNPVALEQNRLTAGEVDAPKAVSGLPDDGEPRGAIAAWRRSVVPDEYAPDHIFVDREAEGTGDLLGNLTSAPARVSPFISMTTANQKLARGTFWTWATGSVGAM